MFSTPTLIDSTKAHDGNRLHSKVSEQSIGLSVSTDDGRQASCTSPSRRPWEPLTQKAHFLISTILASGALIAVLKIYLDRSDRDSGILFAPKIDDLPLQQTFCYLYLPTIVSLVLSFIWTWIDLDIKRLAPFVQLSRPDGALGRDSVLLHYPFDFVAFVPFAAIRRRHWPVLDVYLDIDVAPVKKGQYKTMYVGYWWKESMGSSLIGNCPKEANQTFLVRWSSTESEVPVNQSSPLNFNTTLWCRPYYCEFCTGMCLNLTLGCIANLQPALDQQEMRATVALPRMEVLDIVPLGLKEPLPDDLININDFESSISEGHETNNNRASFPTSSWPEQEKRIKSNFPELVWNYYLPTLASFALGAYQRPVEDYLDAETLKDSYQAAYRLLLARKLADVLSTNLDHNSTIRATRRYQTQTVIMVPTFVYIVEGLLATTTITALLVFVMPSWKRSNLVAEPGSMTSLIILTGNDHHLVDRLSDKDCATSQELEEKFSEITFALPKGNEYHGPALCYHGPEVQSGPREVPVVNPTKSILPFELSWLFGLCLIILQGIVLAALVYTFVRAQLHDGLPLPSDSLIINQILVKYLPMVLGAFFEPISTWLTRTLCMLQPYEQLRKGNAPRSRSLDTTYNCVPPQAVIFKVFKSGHLSLASLCCLMTLLANVISVAFSSLLYERTIMLPAPHNFTAQYQLPISPSGIPSQDYDHFYVAMSNLTANTPLPAWTDQSFFYVPFQLLDNCNTSTTLHRARTPAISAYLHCYSMNQRLLGKNLTWDIPAGSPGCNISTLQTYGNVESQSPGAIEHMEFSGSFPGAYLSGHPGWGRSSTTSTQQPLVAFWLGCQPTLHIELREVTVDQQDLVQTSVPMDDTMDHDNQLLQSESKNILTVFHTLLTITNTPKYPYAPIPNPLHNDSYPSDFFNYLIAQTLNSSATIDPHLPPPSFNTTAPVLEALYTQIFAIVLGMHYDKILQTSNQTILIAGSTLSPVPRIFVSSPMFTLSIVILGIYIMFTITLYVRRPWRILPRMPTSIINQIPFFAASHMLQDLATTSPTSGREQSSNAQGLRQRYGFGRFIGTDGKAHIGIEREPLVQTLTKRDLRLM
ncbi:hypothetical protein E4T44_00934 [Aureobasidium sp. EXF-8845]|nr:hypothetical protein E4T44_00934 [Aureobasidium sp. EXF-8845]KAI4857609.1 hypothetical protein E4T45_00900 [Aureobasidium sp. EXF-8846]